MSVMESAKAAYTVSKSVYQVYSVVNKTPLKYFLPGPETMIKEAITVVKAANSFQQGMKNMQNKVNEMINKAAEQAKLPTESMSKITDQVSQVWKQTQDGAASAAGAVENAVGGEAH